MVMIVEKDNDGGTAHNNNDNIEHQKVHNKNDDIKGP